MVRARLSRSRRLLVLAAFAPLAALAGGLARPLPAAELRISLSDALSCGEPVELQVEVVDPERGMGAPRLSPVEGLRIRGPAGPSQSVQTTIAGGRRRVTTSYVYSFRIEPLPGRTGTFTIGPVTVSRAGGPPLESGAVKLGVYKPPPLEVRFLCELSAPSGPLAAPFRVTYRILFPKGARAEGPELSLPLLELAGVRLTPVEVLPGQPADRNAFGNTELRVQKTFTEIDGMGYETLLFGFDVVPLKIGSIDAGGASLAMELTTGETEVVRDWIWGRRRVHKTRTFRAETGPAVYTVDPLPAAGRPEGFTGAVGRFRIEVSADKTEVNAYDPIRLTVRVRGSGLLEELQPPAWSELPLLSEKFEVSSDVDSGEVEGEAKVFTQVIRPRDATVTEIPPIPFPYYDPWRKEYAVARSEPIPIRVRAVRTVGGEHAIPSPGAAAPRPAGPVKREPAAILAEEGVGANFLEIGEPRPSLEPRALLLRAPFLVALGLPPALFLAVLVALRWALRDLAAEARARAYRTALAELAAARDAEAVSRAYQEFFRRRFGLPAGELTPEQVLSELEGSGIDGEVARRAAEHLDRLLLVRFGGEGEPASELAGRSRSMLEEVVRCRAR